MNLFNKTEAIGLFLSVAIMAIALSVVRFKTDLLVEVPVVPGEAQSAVVAVSQQDGSSETVALEEALRDGMTSSGELVKLIIDDVRTGNGDFVKKGDTVTMHYKGETQKGQVPFGNSYLQGEPYTFTVGEGKVIEGLEKGLIGMQVGGQRILVVPPSLAYGNGQAGPIPPNSTLIFSVELLDIK